MKNQSYEKCSGCKYMLVPCDENGTAMVSGVDSELSCALEKENATEQEVGARHELNRQLSNEAYMNHIEGEG